MVMGLKGIAHDLAYLSNDDVETPSAMMGKKMVPILELGRAGSDEHEVTQRFWGGRHSIFVPGNVSVSRSWLNFARVWDRWWYLERTVFSYLQLAQLNLL